MPRQLLYMMIAAGMVGCGSANPPAPTNDETPNLDSGRALSWQPRPAIVQTLRLVSTNLRSGDTLKLESTLKNVSNRTLDVERVNCELDIDTTMQMQAPLIYCFAYSMKGPIAPGETVTGRLERVVSAPPGRYSIAIKHLLNPDVWVPAKLTVHPR